ncbi:Ig-like domain repeat protein, partial [Microbacterium sp. zg.Y909]|uniref:Ig-like domain repeat protein n=1 Tax=Microbacterium sp. zg.Y909 TaxID=2969413 RepID=UPI00214CE6E4
RITSVTVDGQPIDPAAEYRIGTFSFLASGGDNFRVFTEGTGYVDTGLLDYEAWVDYIADNSPLAPSYAKQAVQVTGVPETVEAGAQVQFSVAGLNLTSRGAPENTTLSVALGDTVLGEVPVTAGAATVSVTLPAGVAAGAAALTLTAQPSGTVVAVPIEVAASTVEKAQTSTHLVALLPVHINRFLPTTLVAYVQQSGARADGTVEFREGGPDGAVIGTAPVRGGLASLRLGTLTRGTHSYTAVFVPRDAETVAGSQSAPVKVRAIG